jgi:hypothetical protein
MSWFTSILGSIDTHQSYDTFFLSRCSTEEARFLLEDLCNAEQRPDSFLARELKHRFSTFYFQTWEDRKGKNVDFFPSSKTRFLEKEICFLRKAAAPNWSPRSVCEVLDKISFLFSMHVKPTSKAPNRWLSTKAMQTCSWLQNFHNKKRGAALMAHLAAETLVNKSIYSPSSLL